MKFRVTVMRTYYRNVELVVNAEDDEQAIDKAVAIVERDKLFDGTLQDDTDWYEEEYDTLPMLE